MTLISFTIQNNFQFKICVIFQIMMDPNNLQFGGLPPPDHAGHHFANMHGMSQQHQHQQQSGPSPPAPSPGGLQQLVDGFAEQQQQVGTTVGTKLLVMGYSNHLNTGLVWYGIFVSCIQMMVLKPD